MFVLDLNRQFYLSFLHYVFGAGEGGAAFLSSPLLKLTITTQGQKLLIIHILNRKQRRYLSNCEMIMTFPIIFPKPSLSKFASIKKKLVSQREEVRRSNTQRKRLKKFKCKTAGYNCNKACTFKRTFERYSGQY